MPISRSLFRARRRGVQQLTAPLPTYLVGQPTNTWLDFGAGTLFSTGQTYTEPSGASKANFLGYAGCTRLGDKLYIAGGGHGDAAANCFMSLGLEVNAPAWSVLNTPTTPVQQERTHYDDGRPAARHTSWSIQAIAARNRIFMFGGWAMYGNGNTGSIKVDALNLGTNDYDAAGTYPDQTGLNGTAPPTCQDNDGNVYVWRETSGELLKWTQTTGAWSQLLEPGPSIIYNTPIVYDPVRNRIVLIDGSNSRYFDLTAGTTTTFSTTASRNASIFWCEALSAFLYKAWAQSSIQIIDPVTYVASAYSVSGTPPAEASDGANQVYDRFGYYPARRLIYYQSQVNTNLHGILIP